LQYLCDNSARVDEFKNKATDYICNKYDWDDVTAKTLELYGIKETTASMSGTEEKEYENIAHK